MVEPLRHRQTKGAANRHAQPKATAPHSYSTDTCRSTSTTNVTDALDCGRLPSATDAPGPTVPETSFQRTGARHSSQAIERRESTLSGNCESRRRAQLGDSYHPSEARPSLCLLAVSLGEGGEPTDVADADALALDHDAKLLESAKGAREALGLHPEAAGDQRLFIGQCNARGAGGQRGLLDEKAGDALRCGLRLQLLDLVDQLSQPHGGGGQHVERQLRLIEHRLAQLRRVDLEDARRRRRVAARRIAAAEEHGDLGEGLAG